MLYQPIRSWSANVTWNTLFWCFLAPTMRNQPMNWRLCFCYKMGKKHVWPSIAFSVLSDLRLKVEKFLQNLLLETLPYFKRFMPSTLCQYFSTFLLQRNPPQMFTFLMEFHVMIEVSILISVINQMSGNVAYIFYHEIIKKVSGEHLAAARGTLRFCRTPVEKHCSMQQSIICFFRFRRSLTTVESLCRVMSYREMQVIEQWGLCERKIKPVNSLLGLP